MPYNANLVHIKFLITHKFHFSATFSLKISPTVLFTHLKIILLQYFSVFSFQLYPNRLLVHGVEAQAERKKKFGPFSPFL